MLRVVGGCNYNFCVIGDKDNHIDIKNGPKEGMSACLAVTANGKKLRTLFIKKGLTTRCIKDLVNNANALWTYSEKGWTTTATMLVWLKQIVLPFTRGRPAVVVMDDYSAHWTNDVRQFCASNMIHLIKVPPGETAKHQGLDVSVMGPLKAAAKKQWRIGFVEDPEKKLTLNDGVQAFIKSYHHINPSTVTKGFNEAIGRSCSNVPASPDAAIWRPPRNGPPPYAAPIKKQTPKIGNYSSMHAC